MLVIFTIAFFVAYNIVLKWCENVLLYLKKYHFETSIKLLFLTLIISILNKTDLPHYTFVRV